MRLSKLAQNAGYLVSTLTLTFSSSVHADIVPQTTEPKIAVVDTALISPQANVTSLTAATLKPNAPRTTLASGTNPNTFHPADSFVDTARNYFYYSDLVKGLLRLPLNNLSTTPTTVIPDLGLSGPNRFGTLAFDSVNNVVYWMRGDLVASLVSRVDLDNVAGTYEPNFIRPPSGSAIFDINLDSSTNTLFYQQDNEIYRKNLSTNSVSTVINSGGSGYMYSRFAIDTTDPAGSRVYWFTSDPHGRTVLKRAAAYGLNQAIETIYTWNDTAVSAYFPRIDVTTGDLYWVENASLTYYQIRRMQLRETGRPIEVMQDFSQVFTGIGSYRFVPGYWTINGKITSPGGSTAIPDVSVKLVVCNSNGSTCSTSTISAGSSGLFSIQKIPHGSKYTLSFSKAGYAFSPGGYSGTLRSSQALNIVGTKSGIPSEAQ